MVLILSNMVFGQIRIWFRFSQIWSLGQFAYGSDSLKYGLWANSHVVPILFPILSSMVFGQICIWFRFSQIWSLGKFAKEIPLKICRLQLYKSNSLKYGLWANRIQFRFSFRFSQIWSLGKFAYGSDSLKYGLWANSQKKSL